MTSKHDETRRNLRWEIRLLVRLDGVCHQGFRRRDHAEDGEQSEFVKHHGEDINSCRLKMEKEKEIKEEVSNIDGKGQQ
jgi:hypothetical protein